MPARSSTEHRTQQGQRLDIARRLSAACASCATMGVVGKHPPRPHPLPMGVIMSAPIVNRDRQSKRRKRDDERRKARQSKAAARRSFGGRK